MQNELNAGIAQIATFMICAQAIAHFRPKESYAKYLRMLLSLMILVQIFQPFCSLFFGVSSRELTMAVEEFQEKMDESMEKAAESAVLAEEKLENMSLWEVQERVAAQEKPAEQEKPKEQEKPAEQKALSEQKERITPVEEVEIDVNIESVKGTESNGNRIQNEGNAIKEMEIYGE